MSSSVQHKITTIKKRLLIRSILRKGFRIHTKFGIFFLGKENSEGFSFAVLIKKSIGKAVHRNYCKRIVREYIRNNKLRFGNFNSIIFLFNYNGAVNYYSLSTDFDIKIKAL